MNIPLDEVVHYDSITSNPSTGAATDADSAPTFEVFEEATDTAIVSGTTTKRTGKTGNYRGTFTLSIANGFEVGKWYNVTTSGTVGGVTGKYTWKFRLVAAEEVAGVPKVDTEYIQGDAPTVETSVEIADSILARDASAVEDTAGEHSLCGLILSVLEWSIAGNTLTIKKTDGTTTFLTKTLTTTAGAAPITALN